MKKGIIIGFIIGFFVGCCIGRICNNMLNNAKKIDSSLNEYDRKFIGKWEYGTKYEDIEPKLEKVLSGYKEKYKLKEGKTGCEYTDGYNNFLVSSGEKSTILTIHADGTIEYVVYYGIINYKCEIQLDVSVYYKGTFENSKMIFKQQKVGNDEWKDIRIVHHIYLEDNDTLRYKVNDENPSSDSYLFMRKNES